MDRNLIIRVKRTNVWTLIVLTLGVVVKKRLLEFLKASFFEPYFLGTPLELEGVVVASRKRQRGFDADFIKSSLQINKFLQ